MISVKLAKMIKVSCIQKARSLRKRSKRVGLSCFLFMKRIDYRKRGFSALAKKTENSALEIGLYGAKVWLE